MNGVEGQRVHVSNRSGVVGPALGGAKAWGRVAHIWMGLSVQDGGGYNYEVTKYGHRFCWSVYRYFVQL